ncbi:hypothetical protein ABES58_28270 [Paenibacillus lautus]|uniref:hypothetical protein n=1 Tax=Paenibacillus lautus TaxID=1401 RepID=UPI003D2C6E8C
MKATKRNTTRAYSHAVYAELQKRGQSPEQALRTIRRFYRPLHRTWGLELNPEAFVDEMLKLQQIRTHPKGNTVTIKPHIRTHNGGPTYVRGHKRTGVLNNSRVHLKVDRSTGKIDMVRD